LLALLVVYLSSDTYVNRRLLLVNWQSWESPFRVTQKSERHRAGKRRFLPVGKSVWSDVFQIRNAFRLSRLLVGVLA
jgi:hypothetical protein